MILYGRNAVREALRGRRAAHVGTVWASAGTAREPWLAGVSSRPSSAAEIERRCGSSAHQGVCAEAGGYPYVSGEELLARAESGSGVVRGRGSGGVRKSDSVRESGSPAVREPLIVALDEVQDPQNLGSICRTAECVGATGVAIPQRRAAEVTPAACKASAGALEHLRVARVRNLADFLLQAREAGCWCYGASAESVSKRTPVPYDAPDYRGAGVVLVLGSEGRGLRPRVAAACDELIALPLHGRVGSLGVSAAAAAVLYEILQDRDRIP